MHLCPRIHSLKWPFTFAQQEKIYAKLVHMRKLISVIAQYNCSFIYSYYNDISVLVHFAVLN